MNTTQQRCFLAAAERLSFTAAAEELFMSQPALSRHIAALENELGLMLFQRRNNVLSLTPGGRLLAQWMRESAASLERAVREARRANAAGQNSLVLGLVNSEVLSERDSRAIALFRRSRPEVELTIVHSPAREIVRRLTEQRLDVAVMIGAAVYGNQRLQYLESARFRRCVAVSIAHPLAGEEARSLGDFAGESFLSLRGDVSPTMTPMVRQVCGEAGFEPRIAELESIEALMAALEAGRGVSLVVENHVAAFDPLLKCVALREHFPVSLLCVWDRLNANPLIGEYLEIFKSLAPAEPVEE